MSNLLAFNPFESDWNCLHPQVILNPKFPELVAQYGNYILKGDYFEYHVSPLLLHTFPVYRFSPGRLRISVDDLTKCYVLDHHSGEIFPMYLVVPCGHCIICQDAKVSNFARRCQYETQCYDCDPVHITITYDERSIPYDRSVNLRHIQLWKKRFRKCLDDLMYNRTLRMCVAAEYGKRNTRRPHYHVIIWNLKEQGIFDYQLLRELAWSCWYSEFDPAQDPMCDLARFTLSPINENYIPKGQLKSLKDLGKNSFQAFGYVAKYFYKDDGSSVPDGCKPIFHTFSKSAKIGGIGAPFIDKHSDKMRHQLKKEFNYLERCSNTVQSIRYDRYVLNRVFPSKYSSVPYKVRNSLQVLFRYGCCFTGEVERRILAIYNFFLRLYPILPLDNSNTAYCFRLRGICPILKASRQFVRWRVLNAIDYLELIQSSIDVDRVLYVDNLRHKLLAKIFPLNRPKENVWQLHLKLMHYRVRRKSQFSVL